MGDMVIRSATLWSGALQAAATVIGHLKGSAPWGSSEWEQDSNTARKVVHLAAHIIVQMPDDPESGVRQAKEAAHKVLKKPPA